MLRRSLKKINQQKLQRAKRVRAKISGSAERPRVSVFRSLKHFTAQAINDNLGKTVAAIADKEVKGKKGMELAGALGVALAEKLIKAGVKAVVFDKGRYQYHGKVKAFADGLRQGGLNV